MPRLPWRTITMVLAVTDLCFGLWFVHERWFITQTWLAFVLLVWGAIAAVAAGVIAIARAYKYYRVAQASLRGEPIPKEEATEDQIAALVKKLRAWLRKPSVFYSLQLGLFLLGFGLAMLTWWFIELPFEPASSTVAVNTELGKIYVADYDAGMVHVFQDGALSYGSKDIPIGATGNLPRRGSPVGVAFVPRSDMVLVSDQYSNEIDEFIGDTGTLINSIKKLDGEAPRWISVSPDGRKAYVSSEQTVPHGRINVIDTSDRDPNNWHKAKSIDNVNSPEGSAISPDGKRLYVATQSGYGKDPIFIVDTVRDEVIDSFPGFAIGRGVAIDPSSPWCKSVTIRWIARMEGLL